MPLRSSVACSRPRVVSRPSHPHRIRMRHHARFAHFIYSATPCLRMSCLRMLGYQNGRNSKRFLECGWLWFWVAAAGYGSSVTRLGGRRGARGCATTQPSRCPRRHRPSRSLAGGPRSTLQSTVLPSPTQHSSSRLLATSRRRLDTLFWSSQGIALHGAAAILALRPLECGHSIGCWWSANSKRVLECGWLPSWSHIL